MYTALTMGQVQPTYFVTHFSFLLLNLWIRYIENICSILFIFAINNLIFIYSNIVEILYCIKK